MNTLHEAHSLWTDQPILGTIHDRLNFSHYADVLTEVVETLAVFSTKGLLQNPARVLTTQAESNPRPFADNHMNRKKGASAHERGQGPEGTPTDRDPKGTRAV